MSNRKHLINNNEKTCNKMINCFVAILTSLKKKKHKHEHPISGKF